MRVVQQPAFVLHRRPYGETSLLLEVFTRNYGRLGLLAKGARRPRRALSGVLKPFQELLIGWSGRGELPVLNGAEPCAEVGELGGEALYCGFYMNELLLRLLHRHDPHEGLFDDYRRALAALGASDGGGKGQGGYEAVLRIFEKRLLAAIGFGLVLDRDVGVGSPIESTAVYDYILERGPVRLAAGGDKHVPPTNESVRVRGATLCGLRNETLDAEGLREAKRLLRAVLARHLGPRPLTSRELYARLRAARTREPLASDSFSEGFEQQ